MPDLLVRNLDVDTVNGLKARAKRRGRSLQSELRDILTDAAEDHHAQAIARMKEIQARFAGRKFSDSAELIREDRDNDDPYR